MPGAAYGSRTVGPWRLHTPSFERELLRAPRRRFKRGEIVHHEGDLGDAVHVVLDGRFAARVEGGNRRHTMVALYGPGDLFGELALMLPERRHIATVTALTASEAARVEGMVFMRLLEEDPATMASFVAAIAGEVRHRTLALADALHASAEDRVRRALRDLGELSDGSPIPLTQTDLASLTGVSRATVNRILREEARRGTVRLARGRVAVVRSPAPSHGRRLPSSSGMGYAPQPTPWMNADGPGGSDPS